MVNFFQFSMELITMINATVRRISQKIDTKKRDQIKSHFYISIHIRIQFSNVEHLTKELLTPFALPASIAVLAFSCITLASRHTTTPLSRASKKLSPDTISESETWKKEGEKKNDRKSFTVIHTNANFCCSSRGSRNTFPWNDILIFASAQRIA